MYPTTKSEIRKIGCRVINEYLINCRGLQIEIVSMPKESMGDTKYRSFFPIQTVELSQGLSPQVEAEAMVRAVNSQYKAHGIQVSDKSPLVEGVKQTLKGVEVDYSGPSLGKQMRGIPGMEGISGEMTPMLIGALAPELAPFAGIIAAGKGKVERLGIETTRRQPQPSPSATASSGPIYSYTYR